MCLPLGASRLLLAASGDGAFAAARDAGPHKDLVSLTGPNDLGETSPLTALSKGPFRRCIRRLSEDLVELFRAFGEPYSW